MANAEAHPAWEPASGEWHLREVNPFDAADAVESRVEGGDCFHTMVQHHSSMHCVAAGDPLVRDEKIASPVRVGESDAQDHGTNTGEQVVDVPSKIAPSQRSIAVKDLLKNLRAGTSLNFSGANLIEEPTGRSLVRMICPRDVHRDVRVHKNGQMRPDSISISI